MSWRVTHTRYDLVCRDTGNTGSLGLPYSAETAETTHEMPSPSPLIYAYPFPTLVTSEVTSHFGAVPTAPLSVACSPRAPVQFLEGLGGLLLPSSRVVRNLGHGLMAGVLSRVGVPRCRTW